MGLPGVCSSVCGRPADDGRADRAAALGGRHLLPSGQQVSVSEWRASALASVCISVLATPGAIVCRSPSDYEVVAREAYNKHISNPEVT